MSESSEPPKLEITASRQFTAWLAEQHASLAFTTYQAGKLFVIGLKDEGKLSIFERTFERCMGLGSAENGFWMSSLYQLWRFENAMPKGKAKPPYDAVYIPQMAYTTGDLDIHDVVDRGGETRPVFVNTLFSCLAEPSQRHSFKPVWKPPFITKLAAEDRCHLNGLAFRDEEPRYVTMVGQSDVHEGWRDHRVGGGLVMDVVANEVVASGLSMPHSPRWYRDTLYLINSGTGEFGRVDLESGQFEPIAFCPGYARGLAFVGDFAVVGLSECRENRTFSDLPLNDTLSEKGTEARCGLQIIDLRSGDVVHSLNCRGVVKELYDVAVLPGVRCPSLLGFKTDEIRRTLTIEV